MALKIVRNDITQMTTEAIVNTANEHAAVGTGCDSAVYKAAGYDELLAYRKDKIGSVPEGEVFITPGFHLQAKYIIHAVSPHYVNGKEGEEEKLHSCYRKSLWLAKEYGIRSIAFPLISTGGFGYPKEEGMRIAVDEIHDFLFHNEMDIYLVVFDDRATSLGKKIAPNLEEYIDQNYAGKQHVEEYVDSKYAVSRQGKEYETAFLGMPESVTERPFPGVPKEFGTAKMPMPKPSGVKSLFKKKTGKKADRSAMKEAVCEDAMKAPYLDFEEMHQNRLEERIQHISDTFSQYLLYLIRSKDMDHVEVYKRAIVDKKIFSKIKNNVDYHPQKLTVLCLCVGARLNLDETRDLLARAGYALSPCDKTDIIFSYFIENEIYDMIELDIQLEEHGLPCVISYG